MPLICSTVLHFSLCILFETYDTPGVIDVIIIQILHWKNNYPSVCLSGRGQHWLMSLYPIIASNPGKWTLYYQIIDKWRLLLPNTYLWEIQSKLSYARHWKRTTQSLKKNSACISHLSFSGNCSDDRYVITNECNDPFFLNRDYVCNNV